MTSTDRAKAFIARRLKQTALVILPLTAAAIQCHATVNFTGAGSFNASGAAVITTSGSFNSSPINNGINGFSMFGSGMFTAQSGGLGNGGVAQCGDLCGGFFAEGEVSGIFDSDTMLVTFLFTPTASNLDSIDWDLLVNIGDAANSESGTVASGSTVSDSFNLTGLFANQPDPNTFWQAQLTLDFHDNFSGGDSITVNVPPDSTVDIGAQSGVPEPATALLLGPALGGLLFFRRRYVRKAA